MTVVPGGRAAAWRGRARRLLPLVLGLALLAAALRLRAQAHSSHGAFDSLGDASLWWLSVALGLEAASYVSQGLVLRGAVGPPWLGVGRSTAVAVAALGTGGLLPGQPLPAGAITYRELRRTTVERRRATIAATVLLVAAPAGSMVILAGPTLIASGLVAPLPTGWRNIVLAAGVISLAVGGLLVATLAGGVRLDTDGRLAALVDEVGGRRAAACLLALGGCAWLFDCACLYATGLALDLRLPLSVLPIAYVTSAVIAALPFLPGGLGGIEVALPSIFAAAGMAYGDAALVVLAWRAIAFWLPTLTGIGLLAALESRVPQAARS